VLPGLTDEAGEWLHCLAGGVNGATPLEIALHTSKSARGCEGTRCKFEEKDENEGQPEGIRKRLISSGQNRKKRGKLNLAQDSQPDLL
jgi:hypothetical protein